MEGELKDEDIGIYDNHERPLRECITSSSVVVASMEASAFLMVSASA